MPGASSSAQFVRRVGLKGRLRQTDQSVISRKTAWMRTTVSSNPARRRRYGGHSLATFAITLLGDVVRRHLTRSSVEQDRGKLWPDRAFNAPHAYSIQVRLDQPHMMMYARMRDSTVIDPTQTSGSRARARRG